MTASKDQSAAISPETRALLEARLKERRAAAPPPRILPSDRRDALPLSFAQQRLWFLDRLEPGSSLYNVPMAGRVRGVLDLDALGAALESVVSRHDALRTTFREEGGNPVQVISAPARVEIPLTDLRDVAPDRREGEARRMIAREAIRPFDLAQGPLLRAHVFRLAADDHVLLFVVHHIVFDHWSAGIFFRELSDFYAGFSAGGSADRPPLPIQYADFALWQRETLGEEKLQDDLAYWKRQLENVPGVLELPTDHARPEVQSFRGATESLTLPADFGGLAQAFSAREGVTLFMTLVTAFQVFLHRYTGENDIVVGTPVAGRPTAELEGLIGLFLNTLVLRTDLSGDPSFREALRRVREVALEGHAHQELPFEKLVEELQPQRSLSHSPVFQVMFTQQESASQPRTLGSLTWTPFHLEGQTAKFDLTLFAAHRGNTLHLTCEYATDLFERETIERLLRHFQILLGAALRNPETRISALPLLTEPERLDLLASWSSTRRESPAVELHRLFEKQAEETPGSTALEWQEQRITYRELNSRANLLAGQLQAAGVGPEQRVGICLERSPRLVVAILGVLKAGGAYVPLDPSYPSERLRFMLADSQAIALLVEERTKSLLPQDGVRVVSVESAGSAGPGGAGNPAFSATSANLAYVLYTSGSTGQPKGIAMEHAPLSNLIGWQLRHTSGPAVPRTLQFASMSFDVSFQEIFSTLCAGGTVVLMGDEERRDPALLADLLEEKKIERLFLPFIALQQLAEVLAEREHVPGSLREVITAGERLQITPRIAEMFRKLDRCVLYNHYGPTETHVVTAFEVREASSGPVSIPPIGRPIDHTRVYVLDRRGQPVPIGVAGELCVGGAPLARGYLERPDLTSQRFVPDALAGVAGDRIYRTGDLARYRKDGTFEFLGRMDDQVKVRGFRVEPGEIESWLARHPEVAESVVVAREDMPGDRRLVAYVVPSVRAVSPQADPTEASRKLASRLRGYLAKQLPDHMVPSAFVVLERLPLTPSGKVNRRALPAPERAVGQGGFLPQDTLELVLLKIWEDVLGIRPIGVHDNFFELGGHSLLAVRLFTEIEKAFGHHLPLATLFHAPTVDALAGKLREKGWVAPWSSLVVIQGGEDRPPFFCVPGVGGNILGFYDLARELGPDQPVYGLQAQGLDGKSEPFTRIEDMAAHYIREIKTILPQGPFLLGGASFGGSVAFEIARQLERENCPVALVALFDTGARSGGKSSPWHVALRRRLDRYKSRLTYHGKNLLFGYERRSYIQRKSRTLRRRFRSWIWQLIYKSYRNRSEPLPRVLQDVREASYLAHKEYVPGPYGGKATLFRAGVRSVADIPRRDMGWGRVALGGVEIREVPGDHVDMLRQPHVALLARELRDCIDKAIAGAATVGRTAS
jgi:amino acid adenylation domain-containing protein